MDSPAIFIGHHQAKHRGHVSDALLTQSRNYMYDMLTAPITTPSYHAKVEAAIQDYRKSLEKRTSITPPYPILENLTKEDTYLSPDESTPQLILTISPWIDLASLDPLIAHVSRQVLEQEIAYASFCGATNVLVDGPGMAYGMPANEGSAIFGRAISDALRIAPYLQVHIRLPIMYRGFKQEAGLANIAHLASYSDYSSSVRSTPGYEKMMFDSDEFTTWELWHLIRSTCNYHSRLSIDLIVTPQLPRTEVHSRWFSEPVRIVEFPGNSFVLNKHKVHVLPKTHQNFLSRMMRLRTAPWVLLSDVGPIPNALTNSGPERGGRSSVKEEEEGATATQDPTPAEASASPQSSHTKSVPYIEYVRNWVDRNPAERSPMETFGSGFQDYLQSPLQPLSDNLESVTYEVFEKDPVKYDWYEAAITQALSDWTELRKPISAKSGRVVVAVVGAGRGPLVTRALVASDVAEVPIDIYAIEKNPQAFVLLQRHNATKWGSRVHLVHTDMRLWPGPVSDPQSEKDPTGSSSSLLLGNGKSDAYTTIDILVSELLGSFGDNELSPECLDGVQHLLTPVHGICIPMTYTAHLTPIAAPKLHADLRHRVAGGDKDAWDIPYVVMLHSIDYLSQSASQPDPNVDRLPEVKQAWSFTHPLPAEYIRQSQIKDALGGNAHNTRFSKLKFICADRGVCHGLGGYFESILYAKPSDKIEDGQIVNSQDGDPSETVELSTNPVTMSKKSEDMISWFPIFFPIKTPLMFPDRSELDVSIWRQTDGKKVWYEWIVEAFAIVPYGESQTKLVRVGASELHSSASHGCLM